MHSCTSVLPQRHWLCSPVLAHFEVKTQRSVSRHCSVSVRPPLALPGTPSHVPPCWAVSRHPFFSAHDRQSSARTSSKSRVLAAFASRSTRGVSGGAAAFGAPASEADAVGPLLDEREQAQSA